MNKNTNRPRKILAAWATALSLAGALHAQDPAGLWNFTNGDLAADGFGQALQYAGSAAGTSFGTTTSFGIADIAGQPANVMKIDAAANNGGYRMPVGVAANGGGTFVNNYTLVMDVYYPAESAAVKRPLLETDLGEINTTDGVEFFINPAGEFSGPITALGSLAAGTWYRLGIVVDGQNNQVRLYINGVEQGSFAAGGLDGRLALNPSTSFTPYAELFRDLGGATALGYVNSIQFRDAVLTKGQMQALAGPSAAGVPATIPDVPSFVERWVPAAAIASINTPLGVVLNPGSSELSNFSMTLNGAALTVSTATDGDGNMVVTVTGAPALQPLTDYTLAVSYTDSKAGQKTLSNDFRVPLFFEDFEGLALGPNVDYTQPPYSDSAPAYSELAGEAVWTPTPPAGWVVDQTSKDGLTPMYGIEPPDYKRGVVEFQGWTFMDKQWWATTAGDQRRTEYLRGKGTVAVADPDEWDDRSFEGQSPDDLGRFNSKLVTPAINISAASAGSAFLAFDSSTRTEEPQEIYITIAYDGGAATEILRWTSAGPTFKPDAPNERIVLPLNNPPGATSLTITFGLEKAQNDWWWAIDNIAVDAGVLPPTITQAPQLTTATEGDNVQLAVVASGDGLSYQWFKGPEESRVEIAGATSATLAFNPVTLADDGLYSVRVSNSAGFDFSEPVRLLVLERFGGAITDDLVLHLTFNGNLEDSTGRGNDGTTVGSTPFGSGQIGQGVNFSTTTAGGRNYVTLGAPADLNFGSSTDFTVAFWTKYTQRASDPAFIGNKDWDSGGNSGWVFAASGDGFKWNMGFRPTEGSAVRRDSASALGAPLNNGEWHHIAATFNRTGVAIAYVNGQPVNTVDISGFIGNLDTPAGLSVNIGEDGTGAYNDTTDGSPGFGDAMMDDLGIWRRALGEAEIAAIYQSGLDGKDISQAAIPEGVIAGQWDFDNGDLSATVGGAMSYFDGASGATSQQTEFGTTTSFGIPNIGGQVANVMKFPKNTPAMGYFAPVGGPNGGEGATKKNVYTLIFDILYPAAANNQWRSFIQINNLDNGGDGDLFINSGNGIGISGNYTGTVLPDTWHRIVFVVNQTAGVNQIRKYIDGTFVGAQNAGGLDGRWGLLETVIFFADEDNETQSGYVNRIQVRNEALTGGQVAALGGASNAAIPEDIVGLDLGGVGAVLGTGGMEFTWTPGTGVKLQSTTSLTPPIVWQDVPGTEGQGGYTVPVGEGDAFFRLYRP